MAVLEHSSRVLSPPGERAARRSMRDQIARLEYELAIAVADASPRVVASGGAAPVGGGPRLLDLGELEAVRDELAERLTAVRARVAEHAEREEARRVLVEKMLADPRSYKWVRIRDEEETASCRSWHVRPRFGLIGMLAGWWHVKISSGCPLAVAA